MGARPVYIIELTNEGSQGRRSNLEVVRPQSWTLPYHITITLTIVWLQMQMFAVVLLELFSKCKQK